ncbi:hypothetical protein O5472_26345, partial [Escherichia coli]|nr:hypothetical protein [Escherichia coli]
YIFIHKSIQEYHAAEFIKNISSEKNAILASAVGYLATAQALLARLEHHRRGADFRRDLHR